MEFQAVLVFTICSSSLAPTSCIPGVQRGFMAFSREDEDFSPLEDTLAYVGSHVTNPLIYSHSPPCRSSSRPRFMKLLLALFNDSNLS